MVLTLRDTALLFIPYVHGWFRMMVKKDESFEKKMGFVYVSCDFKSLLQGLKPSTTEPLPDHFLKPAEESTFLHLKLLPFLFSWPN